MIDWNQNTKTAVATCAFMFASAACGVGLVMLSMGESVTPMHIVRLAMGTAGCAMVGATLGMFFSIKNMPGVSPNAAVVDPESKTMPLSPAGEQPTNSAILNP